MNTLLLLVTLTQIPIIPFDFCAGAAIVLQDHKDNQQYWREKLMIKVNLENPTLDPIVVAAYMIGKKVGAIETYISTGIENKETVRKMYANKCGREM